MDDLRKAKEMLDSGDFTAVICKDEYIHTSSLRGVKPLVIWVEENRDFSGYSAADKVVGKATAFLYLLLDVRAVYAQVISKPALQTLTDNGVYVQFGMLVDNIINRQGDGICPFEKAVLPISDKEKAYLSIRKMIEKMNIIL